MSAPSAGDRVRKRGDPVPEHRTGFDFYPSLSASVQDDQIESTVTASNFGGDDAGAFQSRDTIRVDKVGRDSIGKMSVEANTLAFVLGGEYAVGELSLRIIRPGQPQPGVGQENFAQPPGIREIRRGFSAVQSTGHHEAVWAGHKIRDLWCRGEIGQRKSGNRTGNQDA